MGNDEDPFADPPPCTLKPSFSQSSVHGFGNPQTRRKTEDDVENQPSTLLLTQELEDHISLLTCAGTTQSFPCTGCEQSHEWLTSLSDLPEAVQRCRRTVLDFQNGAEHSSTGSDEDEVESLAESLEDLLRRASQLHQTLTMGQGPLPRNILSTVFPLGRRLDALSQTNFTLKVRELLWGSIGPDDAVCHQCSQFDEERALTWLCEAFLSRVEPWKKAAKTELDQLTRELTKLKTSDGDVFTDLQIALNERFESDAFYSNVLERSGGNDTIEDDAPSQARYLLNMMDAYVGGEQNASNAECWIEALTRDLGSKGSVVYPLGLASLLYLGKSEVDQALQLSK